MRRWGKLLSPFGATPLLFPAVAGNSARSGRQGAKGRWPGWARALSAVPLGPDKNTPWRSTVLLTTRPGTPLDRTDSVCLGEEPPAQNAVACNFPLLVCAQPRWTWTAGIVLASAPWNAVFCCIFLLLTPSGRLGPPRPGLRHRPARATAVMSTAQVNRSRQRRLGWACER